MIDREERLWGTTIDEFRKKCELTLWLSGNWVCNSNLTRFVHSARELSLDDDSGFVVECFRSAFKRDSFPDLYDECHDYFKTRFMKLVPLVRETAVKSVLADLAKDRNGLSLLDEVE